jgi:hypothetical protein
MRNKIDPAPRRKVLVDHSEKHQQKFKDNILIKANLEDLKTTLFLNKEMILKYIEEKNIIGKDNNLPISSSENLSSNMYSITNQNFVSLNLNTIKNLHEENLILIRKVEDLFNTKSDLEKKNYRLQEQIEDIKKNSEDYYSRQNEQISNLVSRISEKNKLIENLKREYENHLFNKKPDMYQDSYIVNPTKINIEITTELLYTKELVSKLKNVLSEDKNKNEKLENEIHLLQRELDRIKLAQGISPVKESKPEEYKVEDYSESEPDESITLSKREMPMASTVTNDIYFPDRVQMKKQPIDLKKIKMMSPPKLDFNKIKSKYQPMSKLDLNNTGDFKSLKYTQTLPNFTKFLENKTVNLDQENFINLNKNTSNFEEKIQQDKIEKLRAEIKECNDEIPNLRDKLEKYAREFKENKIKSAKLKDNIKIADDKIMMLENQINLLEGELEQENISGQEDQENFEIIDVNKSHSDHSADLKNLEDSDYL